MAVEMMYGVVRSAPEDTIAHIGRSKRDGAPKGSGRYPLGSGKDPRAPLTDEEKESVIKTGDIKEAIAHISEFTNDELRDVKTRFNLEQEIRNLNPEKVKSGWDYLNKITDHGSQLVKFGETGISLYNTVARVANSVSDSELPVIKGLDKLIPQNDPDKDLKRRKALAEAEKAELDLENARKQSDSKNKAAYAEAASKQSAARQAHAAAESAEIDLQRKRSKKD